MPVSELSIPLLVDTLTVDKHNTHLPSLGGRITTKNHLVESIIKDTDATCKRINGITKGKSVDVARLALTKEILALGQSLVQLEAVDPELSDLSL